MRTTLTLDADVDERLRETAHRERKPFKTVVNEALRLGLGLRERGAIRSPKFVPRTFHSPFRGGIDEGRLNQMADQLEVEASGTVSASRANRRP